MFRTETLGEQWYLWWKSRKITPQVRRKVAVWNYWLSNNQHLRRITGLIGYKCFTKLLPGRGSSVWMFNSVFESCKWESCLDCTGFEGKVYSVHRAADFLPNESFIFISGLTTCLCLFTGLSLSIHTVTPAGQKIVDTCTLRPCILLLQTVSTKLKGSTQFYRMNLYGHTAVCGVTVSFHLHKEYSRKTWCDDIGEDKLECPAQTPTPNISSWS